jgi:hypothetical protein
MNLRNLLAIIAAAVFIVVGTLYIFSDVGEQIAPTPVATTVTPASPR